MSEDANIETGFVLGNEDMNKVQDALVSAYFCINHGTMSKQSKEARKKALKECQEALDVFGIDPYNRSNSHEPRS